MHLLTLLGLSALQRLSATQIPLGPPDFQRNLTPDTQWQDLSARPRADANSTGNLIFDTVHSFLQHWPNTRYRNGHNIVPATVPVNTLLYHGCNDDHLPAVPEWTSTDPEHSWPFCSGPPTNESITGCWQLTLVTSRPLKVLYFDGSSAANIEEGGPMDAQDLLVWGKVDPKRWVDERDRIDDLCKWGREFGIDGYLRMEMDFEIMLCDFSFNGGVELLSADYLAAAWWATIEMTVPNPQGFPVADLLRFGTVHAGSWHNRYPGDTRIVLDLTRLISFYDTSLAPSLIPSRASQQRWDHRLYGISAADLMATLYHVIVDRYTDRLELLQYIVNTTSAVNIDDRQRIIQTQLRVMLTPYIPFTARPIPVDGGITSSNSLS
ncbi:hypothetical protein C8F04DRAFT_1399656 [Mycena alexandri]|uniref:Uncharacterized protein n=1 Tax=Mycena alexandri TaxID=1745969 RepID=A0AAD6SG90_9AGAR|nr:hypothetical protein C8F04DRAFT_1399656 [Mycena alexandri]